MNLDDFVSLLRDELGMRVTVADVDKPLDELPDWDSVHLLWLLTALEQRTGQQLSLPAALETTSLEQLYALAVAQ